MPACFFLTKYYGVPQLAFPKASFTMPYDNG